MPSVAYFNDFVVGLASWLKDESDSAFFRWGCHRLAFAMPGTYPRTQVGLLRLLEQPVKSWYPYDIPEEFNSAAGFIYGGELSKETQSYYYNLRAEDLSEGLSEKRLELENGLFSRLYEALKEAHRKGDQKAQSEYVLLRRFLIENPYTTGQHLRRTFLKCKHVTTASVGDLYEQVPASELKRSVWKCDRCGPLTVEYEQLREVLTNRVPATME